MPIYIVIDVPLDAYTTLTHISTHELVCMASHHYIHTLNQFTHVAIHKPIYTCICPSRNSTIARTHTYINRIACMCIRQHYTHQHRSIISPYVYPYTHIHHLSFSRWLQQMHPIHLSIHTHVFSRNYIMLPTHTSMHTTTPVHTYINPSKYACTAHTDISLHAPNHIFRHFFLTRRSIPTSYPCVRSATYISMHHTRSRVPPSIHKCAR